MGHEEEESVRKPPMVVDDLFEDMKDGVKLLALLEVLSEQKLPCEQGRRVKRIHAVANIGTALKFLEGRKIEELTSNLPQLQSLSSSASSVDSMVSTETASPPSKRKVTTKIQGNAKKTLLKWVQHTAGKQIGIEVKDFGKSWRTGLAFHSVIHAIRPELVDLEKVKSRSNRENLEDAFTIAETQLGIPRLLDPEDVDVDKPDEKSIMTYVAQFLTQYPDTHGAGCDGQETEDLLQNTDAHKRAFHEIYQTRSVNGIPMPPDQLEDMAERFHFVSSASELHLMKMEFLELKYRLLSLLVLAESKLKSWIIKYGRRESVELLLQNYISFIENSKFFEQYEVTYQILKQTAEMYVKADGSVEEAENVMKFMNETTAQWRNLSVEVRSVRSMLEEVISNWDRYGDTVASLQAWLEDAEKMLSQSENAKKDFFRNLPHWIQQHTAMNDAGNFLIETCDEIVSRDLKQQLLLLNGRWRELFMEVKQDIEKRVPVMDAQYKMITKTAHLIAKESPQEEANEMFTTMSRLKEQLSKVKECYSPLLSEAQQLSVPLEELETQITSFYDSLGKINEIMSVLEHEAQSSSLFKQKHQELLVCQESCKKILALVEKGSQSVQKLVTLSPVLKNWDHTKLQRQTADVRHAFQNMIKKTGEWKKHVEANSRLMKKFEESRAELEKVLRVAQEGLEEKGDPEELLRKHTEFFSQLDQRVLNAFLKACDELTDILPEQEQQGLQEAVRKLHKQWKDLQGEAPYHLLHLKIAVEKNRFSAAVEECRAELERETKLVPQEGSEKIIKEHRVFFSDKGPHHLCEKRLQLIEELCVKLPVRDPVRDTSGACHMALKELKASIDSTYMMLIDDPDKWKDYTSRFSEFSSWVSAKEAGLKKIKDEAINSANHDEVKHVVDEIRNDITKRGETLSWLKSRLKHLIDVSSENEAQKRGDELAELSSSFKALVALLSEVEKMLSNFGECVQYKEIVKSSLEELMDGSQESQEQAEKILDTENLFEAQQLLLHHQQKTKMISAKKRDLQQQMEQAQQGGQAGPGQEELQKLESTLTGLEQSRERQERRIQVSLRKWERFETNKETVVRYLFQTGSSHERFLSFSSLESLSSELEQTKTTLTLVDNPWVVVRRDFSSFHVPEFSKRTEGIATQAENLVKEASEIPLGPRNKHLLQQQAKSIKEQVKKLEDTLEEDIKTMEMVKTKWDHFGSNFETLSIWITEKEKELNALETSASALDVQISQIKVTIQETESKIDSIVGLEEEAQSFAQFVTTGESARIKAKLTQIRRYWEELREHARGLEGTILGHLSQQQKFEENLIKDLCQALESLNSTVTTFSASAQKVVNRESCMHEAVALQQQYEEILHKAKERQKALEDLLAHWQSNLLQLKATLFTAASKDDVATMKLQLEQLDERWSALPQMISKRMHFLQAVLAEHQHFDELLFSFSVWIKQFLSELQRTSEISLLDHQVALTRHKDHAAEIEKKRGEAESLQGHIAKLQSLGRAEDLHLLQIKADDCFQLFEEANQVVERRKLALTQLAEFLQSHASASTLLHQLRQTVEATKSMSKKQSDSLKKDLSDAIQDVKALESSAISLDGILTKAQYHLKSGSTQQRTSCRATAEQLSLEVERVQNLLGTKQGEADALAVLKKAFHEQKEELLSSIEDIEERTDKERLKEPTRQALQHRLRVFNQLEDELNSHEHELRWLKDKATQIAQKDMAFAPEVDREINRLEATWEDTKRLIHENQGQCCGLIDLIREYQNLKSAVCKVLENAGDVIAMRAAVKDQEDLKWAFSKVSERIEENMDRLRVSMSIWDDVLSSKDEIEGWANSSLPQLAEHISDLNNSRGAEEFLKEFESEVKNKALKLEELHSKINDLKELTKNPETPTDLQFIEADLRQKLEHAKETTEEAKGTLKDFTAQSTQVERFVKDITLWLINVEESLTRCAQTGTCEGLKKVKLSIVMKNPIYNSRYLYYLDFQGVLDSVSDGQSKLDTVTQEGQTLYAHLPKQMVSSIQEQITKANEEFQAFLKQCLKDKQALQDCASELGSFEDQHRKLSLWLHEMEERLKTENLGESKRHMSEKKNEVHKVEMFLGELLAARESLDKLSQRGQLLSEESHGAGKGGRRYTQLLTSYQNLLRVTKERLRSCQLALQEHEALEEATQSMWSRVKDVQDKLACSESTLGNKETLEGRLSQIQEILLMKGEGEVKLNMAIGKGDQALRSSNKEGQQAIQAQLETLKTTWADVMSSAIHAQGYKLFS
ncbi:hypothetical protein NN561_006292 [Cricetulus griseus]